MKLSYWQKILYASGSLGVALSYQAFATYIQFFYIDILGVKASLVGIGWSIYGIWNAVNDPLAGYFSDNTRSRFGRRIPFAFTMQGITTAVILGLSGYVASTANNLYPTQPAPAVFGIRFMTSAIPILASVVVIWTLQRYPLHGERLKSLRAKIAALRSS